MDKLQAFISGNQNKQTQVQPDPAIELTKQDIP